MTSQWVENHSGIQGNVCFLRMLTLVSISQKRLGLHPVINMGDVFLGNVGHRPYVKQTVYINATK